MNGAGKTRFASARIFELVPTFKPADLHGLPPTPAPHSPRPGVGHWALSRVF